MLERSEGESYVTWLPREQCEEFGNQLQKFKLGISPFIQCMVCEEQFFDRNEADIHSKDIHPIGVASKNHKPYSMSTTKSFTLTTWTCNICGCESKVNRHRCGNCNAVFGEHVKIKK